MEVLNGNIIYLVDLPGMHIPTIPTTLKHLPGCQVHLPVPRWDSQPLGSGGKRVKTWRFTYIKASNPFGNGRSDWWLDVFDGLMASNQYPLVISQLAIEAMAIFNG